MKTKIYLIFILFVSSVFILSSCGSANTDPVHSIASAKTDFYKTEQDLYKASSVVIIAEKKRE